MLYHINRLACLATSLALLTFANAQFVTTNGLQFELNGKPYSFAGANSWTLGATDQGFIPDAIRAAQNIGYTVIRVGAWIMKDPSNNLLGSWGSDGEVWYQLWENGQPSINTGANGLALLDSAVQQAEAAGIQLIMCLINEWPNYGGQIDYVNNLLGDGQSQAEFYTNPTVVNAFKNYVSDIVTRYQDSPAIFAWELANEARCEEPECNGSQVLTTWADQISQYIKSIDPNHLVTFGGYGFFNDGAGAHNWDFNYDGASGEDFAAILDLQNIDFGTFHLYTDDNGATGPDYGLQWLKDHNDACAAANKPCVLEELGVNRNNLDVQSVMTQYQTYILSSEAEAIQGSMDWSSFYVDAACPSPSDPYAICASDPFYGQVVTDFAPSMAAKA
ncbi:hypothetical protein HO173_006409 [Letharia columbiana]|uniref:mannan endo-1,4-beta-mannosidase n=1 Tax=Letharia columbiana TaxID=112416 RepID=A0A8H6L4E9_9LECA|nr:uncharacterized protein HO173_006409 [Letharia columbiana]KAF6235215.1 hypothetical protein HO173_006409 [Letharia columbiana]